ncbi:hypothetical protein CSUI_005302 [Cystoisospora suis]|uniref:Uncharacterized protein n=1 Tax=Cystoisospora suis TaxID=483139 RepID=A0A2C6KXL0_9APIC|nr:hypothetical protein CSUI_005302 [Cystoisospora suis]
MLRLLKTVFEPLATMCQEARVLLDKVSTGSLEEKCWTSFEPRLRKAVPLSTDSLPGRLLRQKVEEQDEETLQESKPRFYRSTALVTQRETSFKSVCEANLLQRLGELYRKGALNCDPDPIDSFDPTVLYRARRIRSFWNSSSNAEKLCVANAVATSVLYETHRGWRALVEMEERVNNFALDPTFSLNTALTEHLTVFEQTWKVAENVLDEDALIFAETLIEFLCRDYGVTEADEQRRSDVTEKATETAHDSTSPFLAAKIPPSPDRGHECWRAEPKKASSSESAHKSDPSVAADEPFDSPRQDPETAAALQRLLAFLAQPDPPRIILYKLLPILILLEYLIRNDTAIYERLFLPRTDDTQDLMKKIKIDTKELKLASWKRLRLHILYELLPRLPKAKQHCRDRGAGCRAVGTNDASYPPPVKGKTKTVGFPRSTPPSPGSSAYKKRSNSPRTGSVNDGCDADTAADGIADMQTQRFEMLTSYFKQVVDYLVPLHDDNQPIHSAATEGGISRSKTRTPSSTHRQERSTERRDPRSARRWEDIFDFVKEEIRNRTLRSLHRGQHTGTFSPGSKHHPWQEAQVQSPTGAGSSHGGSIAGVASLDSKEAAMPSATSATYRGVNMTVEPITGGLPLTFNSLSDGTLHWSC